MGEKRSPQQSHAEAFNCIVFSTTTTTTTTTMSDKKKIKGSDFRARATPRAQSAPAPAWKRARFTQAAVLLRVSSRRKKVGSQHVFFRRLLVTNRSLFGGHLESSLHIHISAHMHQKPVPAAGEVRKQIVRPASFTRVKFTTRSKNIKALRS